MQAAVVVRGLMVSFPSVWKNEEGSEKFMVSVETFLGFLGVLFIHFFFFFCLGQLLITVRVNFVMQKWE